MRWLPPSCRIDFGELCRLILFNVRWEWGLNPCNRLFLMTLMAFTLWACSDRQPQPSPQRVHRHIAIEGSLEHEIQEIYSSQGLEDCDKRIRNDVLELAREMDRRQSEILAVASRRPRSPQQPSVRIAGAHFLLKTHATVEPGWQEIRASWTSFLKVFKEVLSTPTDEWWVEFDSHVRGLVSEDKYRLIFWTHPGVNRDALPTIQLALSKVDECLNQPEGTCVTPLIDEAHVIRFIHQSYYMRYYWQASQDISQPSAVRRQSLKKVKADLEGHARLFKFYKNPAVQFKDGELEVPINVSSIFEGLEFFKFFLEDDWSFKENRLRMLPSDSDQAYRIVIDPSKSGRNHVNYNRKTLNLNNHSLTTSIAHEIGHVLGFPDTYYTSWDSSTCEYITQYRPDDIMSSTRTGGVLREHWDQIKQEYGP